MVQTLEVVEGYDNTSVIENLVYKFSQECLIKHVFACAEFDLYRAERIKQWLGLDFTAESDLRIFRNKIAMKDHFNDHGIKTSKYAAVKSVLDIYDFANKHGFPLVVKQQEGGGGVGTKILRSLEEIQDFSHANFRTNGFTEPSLMVESYVNGKLYHVDGVVFNGEVLYVSCGEYINGLIENFEEGGALGSSLVPANSSIHNLLSRVNQQVIDSTHVSSPFTFHSEYFIDGDSVTLCEIACRTGGACINETNSVIRGVDINAWLINTMYAQKQEPISPRNMDLSGGWVVSSIGHKSRTVKKIANECKLPFILSYKPRVNAGQHLTPAVSNIQGLCDAIFTADTQEEVLASYNEFGAWLQDNFEFIDSV
ncbi:ATP-grasp domain-containing protein [Vibrio cholerae]|nr:ATP-grasp domain-containing protein [Vibrio cholerae]